MRPTPWHPRALFLALLLALAEARAEPPADERPWFVPDHAALQLAGSIGFLSAGPGWGFLDDTVEAGLLLGGSAGRPVPALGLRLLEGYVELVATDYRLVHFLRSPATVETGLFSLALGAKLRF